MADENPAKKSGASKRTAKKTTAKKTSAKRTTSKRSAASSTDPGGDAAIDPAGMSLFTHEQFSANSLPFLSGHDVRNR
jgi:hypothetical protein